MAREEAGERGMSGASAGSWSVAENLALQRRILADRQARVRDLVREALARPLCPCPDRDRAPWRGCPGPRWPGSRAGNHWRGG